MLREQVQDLTGVTAGIGELLAELRHSVTRYRIRLLCFPAEYESGRLVRDAGLQWVRRDHIADMPLTMPARKLARRMAVHREESAAKGG
jgi:A/G-specific adenine glycosylase